MQTGFSKKLNMYLRQNYKIIVQDEENKEIFEPLILISHGSLYEKLMHSDSYLYRKISGFIFELNKVSKDIPEIKKFVDDLLFNGFHILEYNEEFPYIDKQINIILEVLKIEIDS